MHTHLSRDDRAVISNLRRRGYSYQAIGDHLGRDKGAIWQEIQRNKDPDGIYRVASADRKSKARRQGSKVKYRLIENNTEVADLVESLLDPLVSPEVIGHLLDIHHQSIYSWICRSRPDLKKRLPYRGKKRRKYGSKREQKQGWTKDVRPIESRPEADISWEGDTVRGGGKARLLTHIERNSLYTRADLISDGTADAVHEVLKRNPLPGIITYDRGSEFALWKMIERDCGVDVYFADAHAPWQRSKNENTNGRLRRPFPKRFDFSTISSKELEAVVSLMNDTPRKSLAWRTPADVFKERCVSE